MSTFYSTLDREGKPLGLCCLTTEEGRKVLQVFAVSTLGENTYQPGQFLARCAPLRAVGKGWTPEAARRALELAVHALFSEKLRSHEPIEQYLTSQQWQLIHSCEGVVATLDRRSKSRSHFLLNVDVCPC